MDERVRQAWESFLNPDVLRPNLILASLYIAAFEMLKRTIVERLRDFYVTGFDKSVKEKDGWLIDPDYETRVLSRNRSRVYASLGWLKESNVIDDQDIAAFERVKKCRNDVAHEINRLLSEGLPPDLPNCFSEIIALVDKIERWWIVNVEIPTNPDFDGEEIDESGIVPGPIMGLRLLIDIALGSGQDSKFYLNEFLKQARPKGRSSVN